MITMCLINKYECKNEAEEVRDVSFIDAKTGSMKFILYSCEECGEQYLKPIDFEWEL